ncbi:MAG: NADH-quinone oxidoreductase subunit H [Chloroflexi bacterium]|nr:MAG: NADH-quinone oxidoreductase subunit H [Chloroflexota bacterium]
MFTWLRALFALFIFPGFGFIFVCAMAFQWIDRRVAARLQGRIGPPWFQPVADFIKLMAKEDLLPAGANEQVCAALPMVSLAAVLTAGLYIPVGGQAAAAFEGDLIVVLFLLSIPALAYFLAGWVSVSVFSVVGGNRSLLQYFSYEVPFLMALSGPAILSGSWSISTITARQSQTVWMALVQPVGFLLALIGLIGKLKRSPFDIPKAKSEIGAGPLTEFSGRKLALWDLSINLKTVVGIFLLVNVFLAGSDLGALTVWSEWLGGLAFALKTILILLVLSTISVLYARLRIDQLASLGWRVLAPLALLQMLAIIWIRDG